MYTKLVLALLFAFVCICTAQDVTLTSSHYVYQVYEPIVTAWSDACGCHQNDDDLELWHNPPTGTYLHYNGTEDGQTSGSLTIDGPPLPGDYEIQYVRAGGGTAAVMNITVVANYTLTTKPFVVLGEPIVVNYTISAWHVSSDTISLYKFNETDYVNGYLQYRSGLTAGSATGSVTFNGITNSLPKLEIVYTLAADPTITYGNIPVVQVISGVTLTASKSSFGIYDDIVIFYTCPSTHGSGNYIYLFKGSDTSNVNSYIAYKYVDGVSSGNVTFAAFQDTSKTGNYTVTYNVDGGDYIVASLPIQVSLIGKTSTTTGGSGQTTTASAASIIPSLFLLCVLALASFF